jgi:hypothetical protein
MRWLIAQLPGNFNALYLLGGLVVFVIGLIIVAIMARYFSLWIQCITTRSD